MHPPASGRPRTPADAGRPEPHVAVGTSLPGLRVEVQEWLGAPALSYPDRLPALVHALDRAVREHGDAEAVVASEGRVTYRELAELVEGAVATLEAAGLQPGDRFAVAARNGLDLAVALYAAARGRFVLVGLNTRLRAPQWRAMLERSGAVLALAAVDFHAELCEAAGGVGLAAERIRPLGTVLTGRRLPWRGLEGIPLVGGTSVLLADASPREYVELLASERVTWAYCVPSFWLLLLREEGFRREALPDLRLGAFGGSPLPQSLVPALRERMPGLELRGSLVTTGYYRDDEATAAAIRGGWLRTGDLARIDADGYVTVLDRTKDRITPGGSKVFSVEVEQLLLRHPAITDAAVVGVPDPVADEGAAGRSGTA